MTSQGSAPAKQPTLSLGEPGGETVAGESREDASVNGRGILERALERDNLYAALRQVQRNHGSPGIDGMTVEELPGYLKHHWLEIKAQLLEGDYRPQPVKRVELAKPGGGARLLGIPCVVDRFIQQALLQVLQADWDGSFSEFSFGFRPGRSAHQAISQAQQYLNQGYTWVVDLDVEKFFDRVNQDLLLQRVKARVADNRVLRLIDRFLKAGVMSDGQVYPTLLGLAQGGPLSPLLANLLLDELDRERERRGHRFARYADDCNIYVKSQRAGERVLASISRFLARRLKLQVNAAKSAVDRPWKRTFLGFTFSRRGYRRKVSAQALEKLKAELRRLTGRTRGHSLAQIIAEVRELLLGWKAYLGFAEVLSPLRDLEKWLRRKLRCYLWKQWGRRGYRELRQRGVERELAWNTAKSAHGPWRLSKSPALSQALPASYFATLGLPSLTDATS
jgi:group II intron reverse transcriptase/maturase